jgi:hypothetical protein
MMQTEGSRQQAAGSRQEVADSKQQTANCRGKKADHDDGDREHTAGLHDADVHHEAHEASRDEACTRVRCKTRWW